MQSGHQIDMAFCSKYIVLCVSVEMVQVISVLSACDSIVILAGDTRPIEVICHLPVICEENGLPYCYVPSKEVGCL